MNAAFEAVARTQIVLEGLTPFIAVPSALLLSCLVWNLYARELSKLPLGARRWIRALRMAVVLVISAAFMNPTWETIQAEIQKPLVALAVDASRSMEVTDGRSRPEELVRLAVALGVWPRGQRSALAGELAQALRESARELRRAEAVLRSGASRAQHAPEEKRTQEQVIEAVKGAGELLATARKRLEKAVARAPEVENALAADPALLRGASDARLNAERLVKIVLGGFLPKMYEAANAFAGQRKNVFAVEEAVLETGDTAELCSELAAEYDRLQDESDARLLQTAGASAQAKVRELAGFSRREIVQRLLGQDGGLLAALRQKYRVRLYGVHDRLEVLAPSLGETPQWQPGGAGTDWGHALEGLTEGVAGENLAGVLILSDGRHTEGAPPQEKARAIAALGVPLHTAGVGSSEQPVDLALVSVQAPAVMFEGERLDVSAFVRANGFDGRTLRGRLFLGAELRGEAQAIMPKAQRLGELRFPALSLPLGRHRFEVRIEAESGEASAENNRMAFEVRTIARRLRALLVEGLPRWQQAGLAGVLRSDANVSVQEVVLASQPERRKEVNEQFEIIQGKQRRLQRGRLPGQYPLTREDLFENDVLFLGDFPIQDLSFEEQKGLADFVRYKGGSLVLLAGRRHNPYAFEDSALGDLLPVVPPLEASDDEHLAFHPYFQDGFGLKLTSAGRGHGICRLSPDQQENSALWERLPRSYWRFPGLAAHPDATVLARTDDEAGEPLIAARQVGLGRVLYVGLDDIWRWKAADNAYEPRFWRNVFRWAIAGGMRERARHLGLATDRQRYGLGDAVALGVQAVDDDGYGVSDDVLRAQVFADVAQAGDEPLREARLEALEGSPGLYQGEIAGLPEGEYLLRLSSALYKGEAAALPPVRFGVGCDPFLEFQDVTLNRGLLEEIAQEGGGQYFSVDRLNELVAHLPQGVARETTRRTAQPLWDNYVYLLLLLALLGSEWVLRKMHGLL